LHRSPTCPDSIFATDLPWFFLFKKCFGKRTEEFLEKTMGKLDHPRPKINMVCRTPVSGLAIMHKFIARPLPADVAILSPGRAYQPSSSSNE
jgi:hypothetical protein